MVGVGLSLKFLSVKLLNLIPSTTLAPSTIASDTPRALAGHFTSSPKPVSRSNAANPLSNPDASASRMVYTLSAISRASLFRIHLTLTFVPVLTVLYTFLATFNTLPQDLPSGSTKLTGLLAQ